MGRSRSRLAGDWFAKLRVNAITQEVEHEDVVAEQEALDAAEAKIASDIIAAKALADSEMATAIAGATMASGDILTSLKTVDGAGSGLDADLLDGQQGSYYIEHTDTAIANLVDSSPATLDTLNELAAALGDDPNFATTVSTQIGTKLDSTANAVSASKLNTARTIALSGDVTGSITFDGSANKTMTTVVGNNSHTHIIDNVTGLQAALDGKVDDSQVLTNVPAGAVFTDTTYSHPSTHPATMITTTDEFAYSNSTNVQDVLDDLDQAIADVNAKDPVITLTGDVSGSGTMTNLGNVSITATVADDSHNHTIANIDGLQTALDNATMPASEILTAIKTVDGSGSGLDADLLDGYNSSQSSTVNTVAVRDGSGDINARLFRSEYDSTNADCNFFMTQVDTGTNNYMRPSTVAQVQAKLGISTTNGTSQRQSFTATAGQTSFTISGGYTPTFADVYLNGIKLVSGTDVAVSSGTVVTLTEGASLGDTLDVIAYGVFLLANTYTKAEVDAMVSSAATIIEW